MTQEHISAFILILLSLVMLFFPKQIWETTEAWKTEKSKTVTCSKAYAIVFRCVGAVFLIAGFVVLLIL
jgi:hypothetical protein